MSKKISEGARKVLREIAGPGPYGYFTTRLLSGERPPQYCGGGNGLPETVTDEMEITPMFILAY